MSQEREQVDVPVEKDASQDEKENIAWQMFQKGALRRMEERNTPAKKMGRNLIFDGK